ncbi:MAG: hypothetical protein M1839_004406 [Geoglossum umbratile]|nr:MAG: hypothetical protein M1839_004406 [Geoglossum umbratile]
MASGVRAKEVAEKYGAAVALLELAGAAEDVAPPLSPRTEAAWALVSLAAADRILGEERKVEAARVLAKLSKMPRAGKAKRVIGPRSNAAAAPAASVSASVPAPVPDSVPASTSASASVSAPAPTSVPASTPAVPRPRAGAVTRLLTRKGVAPVPPHPATVNPNGTSAGGPAFKVTKARSDKRRNAAGRFTPVKPASRASVVPSVVPPVVPPMAVSSATAAAAAVPAAPASTTTPDVPSALDVLAAVVTAALPISPTPAAGPSSAAGSSTSPAATTPATQAFVPVHTRDFKIPASAARVGTGSFHFYARAPPDQERFIVLEREKGTSVKNIARALFPDDDAAAHKKRRSWVGNRWLGYAQAWYLSSKAS